MSYEKRKELMKQYGVDRIYSYSRISTYLSNPWAYKMNYLEKVGADTSNVYTIIGTIVHDLLEDYYNGKYKYEELADKFQEKIMEWRLEYPQHTFMSTNVETNYLIDVAHYFDNFIPLKGKVVTEEPIKIVFKSDKDKNYVFVGYADAMKATVDKEGNRNVYIFDFKTSSKSGFSGAKLIDKGRQLLLYGIGIQQRFKLPTENIHVMFDMAKYAQVKYKLKTGKWSKTQLIERKEIVDKRDKQIRGYLTELEYDFFEIDELMEKSIAENTFEYLPKEVMDNLVISNAYIEVPFTDETVKETTEWAIDNIDELEVKEKGNWEKEFPLPDISEGSPDAFFYRNLAYGLLPHHPDYQDEILLETTMENSGNTMTFDELDNFFNS